MKQFFSWLALSLVLANTTVGQEQAIKQEQATKDDSEVAASIDGNVANQSEVSAATQSETNLSEDGLISRLMLPAEMSGERAVIATGVYQSQIVGVVPKDFQPISIDRLAAAIQANEEGEVSSKDTVLKSSFYDIRLVDNLLISDRSSIDLQFTNTGSTLHPLGIANLAITSERDPSYWATSVPDFNSQATFESGGDGLLYANVPVSKIRNGEATIDFAWELNGQQEGIYKTFQLKLPRTARTRIVLSSPADMTPETSSGVLRSLPGPPPGADVDSRRDDVRWHTIDAGGLDKISLRFRPRIDQDSLTPTLVRRQKLQYEIGPTGLNWIHTFTLQAPGGKRLPEFQIESANVTSVLVDGVHVRFDQTSEGNGRYAVRIVPPFGGPSSIARSSVVSIAGTAPLNQSEGWSYLPCLTWEDQDVILSHHSCEAQLSVLDPLLLVSWDLPSQWTRQTSRSTVVADRQVSKVVLARGPPNFTSLVAGSSILSESTDLDVQAAKGVGQGFESGGKSSHWSRIRLTRRPVFSAQGIQAQFSVDENATEGSRLVSAKARLKVKIAASRTSPVELQLEPFWNLNKISFTHSGRVIEGSSIRQRGRIVTLWPETEDLSESLLTIQCEGYRRVRGTQQILMLPEMWFVRFQGLRAETTMAITPPDNLNWTGSVELKELRSAVSSLSDEDMQFFDGITDDTVIYRPKTDATPELWLEKPSILVDVRASLRFQWIDEKVHESLVIDAESASQLVRELSIRMAVGKRNLPLPKYRWSLESKGSDLSINLPSTAVRVDQPGQYTIGLGEKSLRSRKLVGRREYGIKQPLRVELPNVLGTASQESEVIVGEGLRVGRMDASIQRVPLIFNADSEVTTEVDSVANRVAAVRLRYDAAKKPWIEIQRSVSDPNIGIVWQQDIELTASSRGADSIQGTFLVSSSKEIKIVYEPDLRLVSLTHNGNPIDLATVPERPIILPAQKQTDSVQAVWSRESVQRGWWRQCRIPFIEMSGVQIKPTYRLRESSDTFALASLNTRAADHHGRGIDVAASSYRLLVHLDQAIAVGWLLALFLFAVSWAFARKRLLALAGLIVMATVSALLWRPWHAAILGWITLPMVAGALLETTRKWNQRFLDLKNEMGNADTSGDSTEFSVVNDLPGTSRHSLGVFLLAVVGYALASTPAVLHAQSAPLNAKAPISKGPISKGNDVHVLIPIDKESKPVGDKVYVSGSVYRELFDDRFKNAVNNVTFLSANYEVELGAVSGLAMGGTRSTVTAQFAVRVRGRGGLSRLPFAIDTLRRIEVRNKEAFRIVRFFAEGKNAVLAELPQGEEFLLKVSFVIEEMRNDEITTLQLSIPTVAASRVTIESDRSIANVDVTSAQGKTEEDLALRRWSANLGPVAALDVRYTSNEDATENLAATINRLFFVRLGKSMTHVDGQIRLSRNMAPGEELQLTVADPRVPILTSPAWSLVSLDSISATRHRLRIRKLTDANSPIQLLWSFPTVINDATSLQDREAMSLPDVYAKATEDEPAWIAIGHDPDLRFTLDDEGVAATLSTEQFFSQWAGYRDSRRPDQTLIADGELPSVVVFQSRSVEHSATVTQQLHLKTQQALVEFQARISSSDAGIHGRSLRVPRNIQITRLMVDGVLVDQPAESYGNYFEFPLGDFAGVDETVIEAVGSMRIPRSKLFTVPQIRLWPAVIATDRRYVVTRERNVRTQVVRPPGEAIDVDISDAKQTELLSVGKIIVASWGLGKADPNASPPPLVGRIQVSAKPEKFGCQQLIKMNYLDGRWRMSSEISFDDDAMPDFIDLEIPTRWCENLRVSPRTRWTETVSANPSFQLVRIACDQATLSKQKLTVSSELNSNDLGRISVPQIEVLGRGERRIEFSLPNRLVSEPVSWETRAVSPAKNLAGRSTFYAESDKWSVELAPLSQKESSPIILAVDSRIFPQSDSVIVSTRWDFVPNGVDSVLVSLPEKARCLGAWTAGTAVAIEREEPGADPSRASRRVAVRVPLALSRLAQSIELLTEVALADARQGMYLPALLDIAEPIHWTVTYAPVSNRGATSSRVVEKRNSLSQATRDADDMRSLALGFAVVNAIDESLDTLAERPTDEVATWLLPWVARYKNISRGSGRQASMDPADELSESQLETVMTDIDERFRSHDSSIQENSLKLAWTALDQKMKSYVQRFLNADDYLQVMTSNPMFDARNYDGYELASVVQIKPSKSPPAIQAISRGMDALRRVLVNLLSLAMVGSVLFLLRPLRHFVKPICQHPAFWLAAVGIVGVFVAPMPVSLAIIFVSATLAFIPSQGHARQ